MGGLQRTEALPLFFSSIEYFQFKPETLVRLGRFLWGFEEDVGNSFYSEEEKAYSISSDKESEEILVVKNINNKCNETVNSQC